MADTAVRLLAVLALRLLLLPGVARAADHATVFIYHRFGDSRYPSTNTSLADFRAHLEILRQGGYQVLPLGEIVDRLRSGSPYPNAAWPSRWTMLSVHF